MMRIACVILWAVLTVGCNNHEDQAAKRIGLFLYADHTAINSSRDGFIAYVKEHPEIFGTAPEIVARNVGGDATKLAAYAEYFSSTQFDVVCALGTPTSQTLAKRNRLNKAVFAAPADAKAAGILDDPRRPGAMITGVTYRPPVRELLDAMKMLRPGLKVVGVLRNPAEQSSSLVVSEFINIAEEQELRVVVLPVHEAAEVDSAADVLASRVEMIFAPNDNTVHSAIEAVLRRANDREIPVVSVDRGSVEKGVTLSIGGDYFEIGRVAGELAGRLVQGANPATTAVVEASKASRMYINKGAIRKLGISLPIELDSKAEAVP